MTNRSTEIGSNEVPLSSIQNQEEYELELEISNKHDDRDPLLTIKTRMTFTWSHLQKYQDLSEFNEKKMEKFRNVIRKTKKIRDGLDEPFNIIEEIDKKKSGKKRQTSAQEYAWADKIEGNIKNTLNMKVIRWGWFTKMLLYALLILSFLNMFIRADFINVLLPVYILAMFSASLQSKLIDNLQLFFIAATVTLGTDFLWLFFRSSVSILKLIYSQITLMQEVKMELEHSFTLQVLLPLSLK